MNEKRYHYYFGHILYSLFYFLDPFCLAHCIALGNLKSVMVICS